MSDPEELETIIPYLTSGDPDGFIAFMQKVFVARLVNENRYDDGRLQHARLMLGGSLIMINQESEDYRAFPAQLHIKVESVDQAYKSALAHGAVSEMEPNLRPHGDKMAGVKDPFGNLLWIAETP